jgi:hypothetical protein
MLKRVLLEDEYFYHSCYLPVKKKWKELVLL